MPPKETQASKKQFEFITVSNPEEGKSSELRTKVKKHVMKDIGEKRRRPRKNPTVLDVVLPDPRTQVGHTVIDPFANFPYELGSRESELVASTFADDDNPQRIFRNEWFPLGQTDPATLFIILSNAAMHDHQRRHHPSDEPRSLDADKYHLLALQSLNQRLTDPAMARSDGLLAAVTGFVVHNDIAGDFEQWNMHHTAMVRLIDIRGGIDQIGFRELRETVSWIEIRGCLPQDKRPSFPIPSSWNDRVDFVKSQYLTLEVNELWAQQWQRLAPLSAATYASYESLARGSSYTEHQSLQTEGRSWETDNYAGSWTSPAIHTLLSRYGEDIDTDHMLHSQEAIRLASTIFTGRVWKRYGVGPMRLGALTQHLLNVHMQHEIDWLGAWQLQAWTLLMGVVEGADEVKSSFLGLLRDLANTIGITIQGLMLQAKQILWLKDAFPGFDNLLIAETIDRTLQRQTLDQQEAHQVTNNGLASIWELEDEPVAHDDDQVDRA